MFPGRGQQRSERKVENNVSHSKINLVSLPKALSHIDLDVIDESQRKLQLHKQTCYLHIRKLTF